MEARPKRQDRKTNQNRHSDGRAFMLGSFMALFDVHQMRHAQIAPAWPRHSLLALIAYTDKKLRHDYRDESS
jgi:hypothetical protein